MDPMDIYTGWWFGKFGTMEFLMTFHILGIS
jgi:hypothetical protein